jgi:four helix bundle protein
MAKIEKFEDLSVWQEGLKMAIDVYKIFAQSREYGLKDQITRACVSVPSNIAEGFERNSNKEFIRFLKISKGSSGEVRTQIYIAMGVGIIDSETGNLLLERSRIISKMLQNLIKTREERF